MSRVISSSGVEVPKRENVFADGSDWVMISKSAFDEIFVPGTKNIASFLVIGSGLKRVRRNNHAEYAEGELAQELFTVNRTTGEMVIPSRSTVTRAINDLITREILMPGSNTRCLRFNRDKFCFKHGAVVPCQADQIRAPKQNVIPTQKTVERPKKRVVIRRKKSAPVDHRVSRREALKRLAKNARPVTAEGAEKLREVSQYLRELTSPEKPAQSREETTKKRRVVRRPKKSARKVLEYKGRTLADFDEKYISTIKNLFLNAAGDDEQLLRLCVNEEERRRETESRTKEARVRLEELLKKTGTSTPVYEEDSSVNPIYDLPEMGRVQKRREKFDQAAWSLPKAV